MTNILSDFLHLSRQCFEFLCSSRYSKKYCIGSNGPYKDLELPTRTFCHLLYWASWSYEFTGEDLFSDASHFLYSKLAHSHLNYQFLYPVHRLGKYPQKDVGNGLIGEAWLFESLSKYAYVFGESDQSQVLRWLKSLETSYNTYFRTYKACDPFGNPSRIDGTFNHQLWKLAILLESDSSSIFYYDLYRLLNSMLIYPDGTIYHLSPCSDIATNPKYYASLVKNWFSLHPKSSGYQLFNLYAFAIIQKSTALDFSNHPKVRRALSRSLNNSFLVSLFSNTYASEYNRPEFEFPFISKVFFNSEIPPCIEQRLNSTLLLFSSFFNDNNELDLAYISRAYELCRYWSKT